MGETPPSYFKMDCIIQKEIKVSEKFIEETIKDYGEMPENYCLGFGDFSGNRDAIIKEIKKRSKVGKDILKMRYNFIKELPRLKKIWKKQGVVM